MIDTGCNRVTTLPKLQDVNSKYVAPPIVHTDGTMYFPPCCASQVLRIDPHWQAAILVGPILPGDFMYVAAGERTDSGIYYFAPLDDGFVLSIDPYTSAIELISAQYAGFFTRAMRSNSGRIYWAPLNCSHLLRLEP